MRVEKQYYLNSGNITLIKKQLKKTARKLANWPIIGRFIRIAVAVIRLPETNVDAATFKYQQYQLVEALKKLETEMSIFNQTLEQITSEQTQRLLMLESSQLVNDNLVKSVPVILRQLTQDLKLLKSQQAELSKVWKMTFGECGVSIFASKLNNPTTGYTKKYA